MGRARPGTLSNSRLNLIWPFKFKLRMDFGQRHPAGDEGPKQMHLPHNLTAHRLIMDAGCITAQNFHLQGLIASASPDGHRLARTFAPVATETALQVLPCWMIRLLGAHQEQNDPDH